MNYEYFLNLEEVVFNTLYMHLNYLQIQGDTAALRTDHDKEGQYF